MTNEQQRITDHDEVRRWAEERGGVPAALKNTLAGDKAGVLYIDFPTYEKRNVDEMTWEEFFKIFDRQNLALVHDATPPGGDSMPGWQLVDRETGVSVTG